MSAPEYVATDPAVLWRAAAGDREAFQLLARIYVEQAPPLLRTLQDSLAAAQLPQAAGAAHALKGMAGLIGATGLAALLQEIERAARAGVAGAGAAQLAARFGAVLREVDHALRHYAGPEQP